MEKKYKPIPDIEALKYHGTPNKPDIKIFVSQRTDIDSETIDNPLYIPVRCGAVNDNRESVTMLGDDTGENISEKKAHYSELTVQYWAWKNIQADYYGLCHYRRYLSFADHLYKETNHGQPFIDSFTNEFLKDCGLLDEEAMRDTICQYDMILNKEFVTGDAITIRGTGFMTVRELWTEGDRGFFLDAGMLDCLIETIVRKYPEYESIAKSYLSGKKFRGFNCFIMKKELFDSLCSFEFDILFEMEKIWKGNHTSENRRRFLAYSAEFLYSLWVEKTLQEKKYRVKETQIILFLNSEKQPAIATRQEDSVKIAFHATEEQLPLLAASISSLLSNISSSKYYEIVVLIQDTRGKTGDPYTIAYSKHQRKMIAELCEAHKNVTLCFYDPREELGRLHITDPHSQGQEHRFYMLLDPWIFHDWNKVVVLKAGLIVESDIAEVYERELDHLCAGAVKSLIAQGSLCGFDDWRKEKILSLGLQDSFEVFDTSVVLLDLKRIRSQFSYEEMIDFCAHRDWNEEELFSVKFESHMLDLPAEWNYLVKNPANDLCCTYAPHDIQKKYRSVKQPKILNFASTGMGLPWITPDVIQGDRFWYYAKQTPFYEQLLYQMMRAMQPFGNMIVPPPQCSKVRQLADIIIPLGTKRREFCKIILPKDSRRWNFSKKLYYSLGGK